MLGTSIGHKKCAVCGRFTTEFNYGVPCCNACKIFFRRLIIRTKPIKKCRFKENCFSKTPCQRKCTFCRFQKCILVGMNLPPFLSFNNQTKEKCLNSIIRNLNTQDKIRNDYLFNYRLADMDPNLDEIMTMRKINYIKKAENFPMNFQSWALYSSVITIEFMKKFPFVNLLIPADQKILLKECYIKLGAFIGSTRAFMSKKEVFSFPDGTDLLPKTEWVIPKISPDLENRIRCRLIGKLKELNISHEEFLLLSVLLLCNPAIANISDNGKALLASYQHMFSSALLQHCFLTHQNSAPSRFAELLGICEVIGKHFQDVIHFFVLLQLNQSDIQVKKLIKDGMEEAYKS